MPVAALLYDASIRLRPASDEDARLEADVLLAHALNIDRAHLLARLDDELVDEVARARFEGLVARRIAREPLAYIVGQREFYGVDMTCAPGALIPRPETEMLVEIALAEIRRRGVTRVADVGTGTGAIAIAIAANALVAQITAIDPSDAALQIARINIRRAGVTDRVQLLSGDLLDGQGVFDVIVANLPYISEGEWASLQPEIREHEPREALVAGPAGTEAIERLLDAAPAHLAPHGVLAAEIGATQGALLRDVACACFPDAQVCVMKDLAGLDRVLVVRMGGG